PESKRRAPRGPRYAEICQPSLSRRNERDDARIGPTICGRNRRMTLRPRTSELILSVPDFGSHRMQPLRPCFTSLLYAGLVLALTVAQGDANWPRWRGPQQNGHTSESDLPVKWSEKNLLWKIQLPGIGQSSPIIWGDRIFLTSYLEKGKERLVF